MSVQSDSSLIKQTQNKVCGSHRSREYSNFCKTCLLVPYKKKILWNNLLYSKQFLVTIVNRFSPPADTYSKYFLFYWMHRHIHFCHLTITVFLISSNRIFLRIFGTDVLTSASITNLTTCKALFRSRNSRKSHCARSGL